MKEDGTQRFGMYTLELVLAEPLLYMFEGTRENALTPETEDRR